MILNSSAIYAVDYDPASARLEIEFTSGRIYTFYRVPESVYHGLVTASSPGWYFNHYIKGHYS
ncbi:MAG TPA: KTSC domain-containing protein [Verrucomicrobiales bacterium]|nr:KTSC domain-containing protein [Verrucomicrobiales bacterium]